MNNRFEKPFVLLAMGLIACAFSPASTRQFVVPGDTALRIRLDDTLIRDDSEVGDPFSATVVDEGDYERAQVYGHVAGIALSGHVKGRTRMVLRFDRLVMPDERRTRIHAEIVELYHAPSGEIVDVEGATNPAAGAGKALYIPPSGPEPALYLAAFSAAARAR